MSEKMKAAFALVEPKAGWREPIRAYVMLTSLAAANVTIEEVKEAVAFFTATEATAKEVTEYGTNEHCGFFVTAAGYRAGPAGP